MSRRIGYQLRLEQKQPLRCVIGRLGAFVFATGRHCYAGSARLGIEARVARHLRAHKALHRHIDYLLGAPGVRIAGVMRSCHNECALNQATPGVIVVPGFGSIDCRHGCSAHLKQLG